MSEESPRGILRNKKKEEGENELEEKFDRQKVYENTLLNAKLNGNFKSRGDEIRARIAEEKRRKQNDSPRSSDMDVLRWDEANLIESEMNKSATMKIDEPKTPYQGSVDPNSEYYRSDDDDDFVLGAAEEPIPVEEPQGNENGEEIKHEPHEPHDPEQDKHTKFEELRKKHYHMKALPLKKPLDVDDEE